MTPPGPKKAAEPPPEEKPEEKTGEQQPSMPYAEQVALRRKLREKYH